ncbi:transcriptional regulator, partial [Escherichia coli]
MTLMAGSSPAATEWFQRATLLRREQLGRLAALGVLVNGISRLVHMLQCERGASNVWLCSQGKLYA